jgi:hypothetical protein
MGKVVKRVKKLVDRIVHRKTGEGAREVMNLKELMAPHIKKIVDVIREINEDDAVTPAEFLRLAGVIDEAYKAFKATPRGVKLVDVMSEFRETHEVEVDEEEETPSPQPLTAKVTVEAPVTLPTPVPVVAPESAPAPAPAPTPAPSGSVGKKKS